MNAMESRDGVVRCQDTFICDQVVALVQAARSTYGDLIEAGWIPVTAPDAARPAVTAADPRVVEVVVPILRAWGLQSHHGEWSDTETRERAARNIAAALAEAGIGDVAEAERRALTETADAWQLGQWAVLIPAIKVMEQPQRIFGAAQAVTDWLRARAATEDARAET
jgi:hypothetical protein